ncbi:solute carrier family 25 member 44-like isoform X2 [Acipenser ruthenus]|uniref:solute carrier family 25 member 44-like isoform X2 n=1 Tax=Acipenser ruthenus TaxID=7906 RepID=UPI0027412666|nr:solute carrier family 25 member 44-like isoform X2 [Acipenser ruthenus]
MQEKRNVQIIEWEDLDKKKFYSFGVFMTMTIRAGVYPATLIRTRLQVQKGKSLYTGTFDAFFKILRSEGVRGLYRGFLVNTLTLISGQGYITTYELVRKYVSTYTSNNTVKSLVAGGSASLVAQSITVPIDVVSQHLMMQGQGGDMGRFKLSNLAPTNCPHLLLQAMAGPMAATTASTITNPMDVVRARVQVEGRSSVIETFKQLIAEEGMWGMTKGLSARIISSTPTAIVMAVGYETLKKMSLRPELVDSRHW